MSEERGDPEVLDYLRPLRHDWILILAMALLGAAVAALLVSASPPVYEAEVELLVRPQADSDALGDQQQLDVDTELQILQSTSVQKATEEALALSEEPDVTAARVGATAVLLVTARAPQGESAARIANAYVEQFMAFRHAQRIEALSRLRNQLSRTLTAVTSDSVSGGINSHDLESLHRAGDILTSAGPGDTNALEAAAQVLAQELGGEDGGAPEVASQFYRRVILERLLDEVQVAIGYAESTQPVVLSAAEEPDEPVAPRPLLTVLIALLLGAVAGAAMALLRGWRRDVVFEAHQLSPETHLIGVLPNNHRTANGLTESQVEAFRGVRTTVALEVTTPRTILITGVEDSSVSAWTALNLAIVFAQGGDRTALVDLDFRTPRIDTWISVPELRSLEAADVGAELVVIPAASTPMDPAAAVAEQLADLRSSIADEFDTVIIHVPSVTTFSDAVVAAAAVDAVILTLVLGVDRRATVDEAARQLIRRSTHYLGAVACTAALARDLPSPKQLMDSADVSVSRWSKSQAEAASVKVSKNRVDHR